MGMNGEFNFRGPNPVRMRCCQYLNNVVEQDHRRVKGRLRPMLGFKTFYNGATRHYRHRTGAEDSQTPVRNSDHMAVESRGDLASRHGSIGRFAAARTLGLIAPTILICTRTLRKASMPTLVGHDYGGQDAPRLNRDWLEKENHGKT